MFRERNIYCVYSTINHSLMTIADRCNNFINMLEHSITLINSLKTIHLYDYKNGMLCHKRMFQVFTFKSITS